MRTRREYIKLKYWIEILLMEDTRIVKAVYEYSKREYLTKCEYLTKRKHNWVSIIHQLVQKYGMEELWNDEDRIWNIPQESQDIEVIKKYWINTTYEIVQSKEERDWKIE